MYVPLIQTLGALALDLPVAAINELRAKLSVLLDAVGNAGCVKSSLGLTTVWTTRQIEKDYVRRANRSIEGHRGRWWWHAVRRGPAEV